MYESVNDSITKKKNEFFRFPTEFFNKLELTGLSAHIITLKIGVIVILLRGLGASQVFSNRKTLKHNIEPLQVNL